MNAIALPTRFLDLRPSPRPTLDLYPLLQNPASIGPVGPKGSDRSCEMSPAGPAETPGGAKGSVRSYEAGPKGPAKCQIG